MWGASKQLIYEGAFDDIDMASANVEIAKTPAGEMGLLGGTSNGFLVI